MENEKKPSVFFIGIIIIIGSYFLMNEYQKMQLVKEAQQKTETFIHRNYEDINEVYINKKIINLIQWTDFPLAGM